MVLQMWFQLKQFLSGLSAKQEKGQGLVEYALILLLVAIVVIVVLTALGGQLNNVFGSIKNSLVTPTP